VPNPLRNLPSVNELIERQPLKQLVENISHNTVVSNVRSFLDNLRGEVQTAAADIRIPTPAELAERIAEWIVTAEKPALQPVINATGVLLHTGLGRAPLAEEALAAVNRTARDYATVEVDAASGQRSQRVLAVEALLKELTGAEAVAVVNNNAGATLITLTALATGQEVIVSRGQLIEIGGSYRLPDVMTCSGARLREVGTTNKTRIDDYRTAIGVDTAAIMRVHTSNYVVAGFSEEATLEELVALGRQRNRPVIDDIGSGALVDFTPYGAPAEPVAKASIAAGADLVLFSGDKLLGGPQCGIIVGKKHLVDKITRHPLMRALRTGKMTLAALAATLELYRKPERARLQVPLLALLETPLENLQNRAARLAPQIAATSGVEAAAAVEESACLGGGSVPTQHIPTWCVAVTPSSQYTVDSLAGALRSGAPPAFGRVQQGRLLLDLKTVFPRHDIELVNAFAALGGEQPAAAPKGNAGTPDAEKPAAQPDAETPGEETPAAKPTGGSNQTGEQTEEQA